MQYAMKVFQYHDHDKFRIIDRDGEPWFVLVDVCRELGIINPSDAASRLDDDEKMTLGVTEGQNGTRGGPRMITIISESGLYSLVLKSTKPDAKKFKKWITSEVLPSIRKTGGYRGKIPLFIQRYNENWDRVEVGHFSVISELTIRFWGRLEQVGGRMADKAPNGQEIRPDVSVGRLFGDWLTKHHPTVSTSFSYYLHKTREWEGEARQYLNTLLPLYIEFVDTVWIPKHAESYFKTRDPSVLPYLPLLLPSPAKASKVGMTRKVTGPKK